MKKILTFLFVFIACTVKAQVYYYRTTEFAYKQAYSDGTWTNWSDWEDSNLLVVINFSQDIVKINSPTKQIYHITKYIRNYTDNSRGKQVEFSFIDQDYDRGNMRLRIEKNGNSQIYIDFANVMWVYNVIRER